MTCIVLLLYLVPISEHCIHPLLQQAAKLHDLVVSDSALHEPELHFELEKVRVEYDQAVSRAADAAKKCEAAKEKACFEGERSLFVEEENRTLQTKVKAMEERLQESQTSGLKAYDLLDQIMIARGHMTRLDLIVVTLDSLPMVVSAF